MTAAQTLLGCMLLLPLGEAGAAVVVTYRGNNPNVLSPGSLMTTPFDINADGTPDYQFFANGFFASFDSFGDNRFVGFDDLTNAISDQVVPVAFGATIGINGNYPVPSGYPDAGWFRGDESGHTVGFLLGYPGDGLMQLTSAYIGVEFAAADGIHYGWIQYTGFNVYQFPVYGFNGELLGYINGVNEPGGMVDSWGYETVPNMPIVAGAGAPEPSRALLLLAGGALLSLKRRRAI